MGFKMVGNVAVVKGTPRRINGTNRRRINSCNEIETFTRSGCITFVQLELAEALKYKMWSILVEFSCISYDYGPCIVEVLTKISTLL